MSLLPSWFDVDTADVLERLRQELLTATNGVAMYTRDFLKK